MFRMKRKIVLCVAASLLGCGFAEWIREPANMQSALNAAGCAAQNPETVGVAIGYQYSLTIEGEYAGSENPHHLTGIILCDDRAVQIECDPAKSYAEGPCKSLNTYWKHSGN